MTGRRDGAAGTRRGAWKKRLGWFLGGTLVLAVCLAIRWMDGPDAASAQAPPEGTVRGTPQRRPAGAPAAPEQKLEVMAVVNGKEIRRQALANACLERYGTEVLESLVNKHLIAEHCRKRNIVVTAQEVEEEIERVAGKFRLGAEQWLKMLAKERGINPQKYARDIIWPTLALRHLAADRLQVSQDELHQAYESKYGEAVETRLIAVEDMNLARQLHAQLQVQPDEFPKLAREHSKDVNSASAGGLLQPIRRHVGSEEIERAVFQMQPGQISPILRIGGQFAIFKCEGHIPPRRVAMDEVREQLIDTIRERKLRGAANDIFRVLQQEAVVENVLNDPVKSRQMPGVAATINGHRITMLELAEECLARHAEEVLDGEINRVLLEEALFQGKLQITQPDLEAEIAHAAELSGVVTSDGRADLPKWIETVTQQQGVSEALYMRDAVWPSAALKKLVQDRIQVTEEDMQKGFEANYGPRVRCRAIVMTNLRRAQEVWDMARQRPTVEVFAELAEQYSIEGSSRALGGQVPPLKRHGGQPLLEREAFKLSPGEISGVIQVGDKFIILLCEGYTNPIEVNMAEVKELIYRDLVEKKLRIAMAEKFDAVRESATIDNLLTGTIHSPKKKAPAKPAAAVKRP